MTEKRYFRYLKQESNINFIYSEANSLTTTRKRCFIQNDGQINFLNYFNKFGEKQKNIFACSFDFQDYYDYIMYT